MKLKTLEDGRVFPMYGDSALSWNISGYMTTAEMRQGYPRAFTVAKAMKEYRPEQFANERRDALRGSFDRIFGRNAQELLDLIDRAAACDCQNPEPESGVSGISESCPIHNFRPSDPRLER